MTIAEDKRPGSIGCQSFSDNFREALGNVQDAEFRTGYRKSFAGTLIHRAFWQVQLPNSWAMTQGCHAEVGQPGAIEMQIVQIGRISFDQRHRRTVGYWNVREMEKSKTVECLKSDHTLIGEHWIETQYESL